MKNFVLEKIYLLSLKERKAREIEFHPRTNLIVGKNHTGKSSLIKNIFKTLGATPQGKLRKWDEGAITGVKFRVDGELYFSLLFRGYRALFDSEDEMMALSGDHKDWSRIFADVTGFNLLVNDKNQLDAVAADPACFFLPFYVDQDGSWQSGWETFPASKRFKAPQKAILEYFTGIKPFKWYELSALKARTQSVLSEIKAEKKFLDRARSRLEVSLPMTGPKIDPSNFEIEVDQLTEEVSRLNSSQEDLRKVIVREREMISSIKRQIALSQDALRAYDGDVSYLEKGRDKLICPVCDAEHDENFLDLFSYAEDARILRDLVGQLYRDLDLLNSEHVKTNGKLSDLEANYKRISEILVSKKGEMKFSDVVNSMSAEHAFNAFSKESVELERKISDSLSEIDSLDERLKELTDKDRSKRIINKFRESYSSALVSLNLPMIDIKRQRLTSRPSLSGSGGPREILAYYSAIWETVGEFGEFVVPIVVDSPNQQGQDHENLPKVLEFVSKKLPSSNQVIIGSEMDAGYEFDKIIELDRPYSLLHEEEFDSLNEMMSGYIQKMIDRIESGGEASH